jgi:hypothetical protein
MLGVADPEELRLHVPLGTVQLLLVPASRWSTAPRLPVRLLPGVNTALAAAAATTRPSVGASHPSSQPAG